MKKTIIVVSSLACLVSSTAFASDKPALHQDHHKRLAQVQSIVQAVAVNDLEKAKQASTALRDIVQDDIQSMPDSALKSTTGSLLNSVRDFREALDKRNHLSIIEKFSNILGNCYGCHIKIRDGNR